MNAARYVQELERRARSESARDYRGERLASGPCEACGAPLVGDLSALLCDPCARVALGIAERRRAAADTCADCGHPSTVHAAEVCYGLMPGGGYCLCDGFAVRI